MPSRLEILESQLPLLPGYSAKKELQNYRKSHALDYLNGVSVVRVDTPGIGCIPHPTNMTTEDLPLTSADFFTSKEETDGLNKIPSWIAFEKQVLRFYGYYREEAPATKVDIKTEPYRIRRVMVYFYLEDDSAQVVEPRVPNSGLSQGNLIRRHRIPLFDHAKQHHTLIHFNVGQTVTFYSRVFHLTSCDASTRRFLEALNINVPENHPAPDDPFEVNVLLKPQRPKVSPHTLGTDHRPSQGLRKFLEQDNHLLRFYCIWDDLNSPNGSLHKMIILYYLADDTIEVREQVPKGTTAEGTASFIRRHRLPKKTLPLTMDGSALGPPPPGSLDPDANLYYSEKDFRIGAIIQIYGRPFVICDMDGTTKKYYAAKHPLENYQPIKFEDFARIDVENNRILMKEKKNILNQKRIAQKPIVPPIGAIAGIGARVKLTRKRGVDDVVFRFSAKMVSKIDVDRDRSFVFVFYYADETLMIFENITKNIGLPGGKFLERSRVVKPDGSNFISTSDLFCGNHLPIHGRVFELIEADKFTKEYMQKNPEIFVPKTDEATEM